MTHVNLYSVCGVLPHRDGLLLLPGISQDRIVEGNLKMLRPGARICLRSEGLDVGNAEVITFVIRWNMERTSLEDAAKSSIALVVHSDEHIGDGTELWLAILQDD